MEVFFPPGGSSGGRGSGGTDGPGPPDGKTAVPKAQPVVTARVLERPAPGRVRIHILNSPARESSPLAAGRTVTARVEARPGLDLSPGREVKFIITRASPSLVLTPAGAANGSVPADGRGAPGLLPDPAALPESASRLAEALGELKNAPPEVINQAARLGRALTGLSPRPGESDAEFVGRLLRGLGLGGGRAEAQEAAARLFSVLINTPPGQGPEDAVRLLEAAARFFDAAEGVRLLNQETARTDQGLHLAFPLFWPAKESRGELVFKQNPAGDGDEKPFRIALLLVLSRLGRLRVDVELKQHRLSGSILTEGPATRDAVAAGLDQLKQNLAARGIDAEGLTVQAGSKNEKPADSLAGDGPPRGLVDIKV